MNNLASHRGPDGDGYFFGKNFAVGHRRLSILDLSEKGHQPFTFTTPTQKKIVLVFNGIIYNYLEIREELKLVGYTFHSETDTEVLCAAYARWGYNCVNRFNGMWAFALYDESENRIFCSRDRFSIKPFYYCTQGNRFSFASEIKQFTALDGWQPKLNKIRAYEFINFGYIDHTEETLFQDVRQLQGGHNLEYDLTTNKFKVWRYYTTGETDYHQHDLKDFEKNKTQFEALLTDAVKLHLRSDVKVGTSLSGGLDSTSIVSIINDFQAGTDSAQMTITASFPGFKNDETPAVEAFTGPLQSLKAYKVSSSFEDWTRTLDDLIWQQDEPFLTATVLANYQVYQKASELGLKVMLDGQGSDEILAGYDKFYPPYFRRLWQQKPFFALHSFFHLLFYQKKSVQTIYRSIRKKLFQNGQSKWTTKSWEQTAAECFRRSDDETMLGCSVNQMTEVGLPMMLHRADRNSMAHGVECRVPFLDYRLVEFCLALPDEFKIHLSIRKHILRETMRDRLPSQIVNRYDKLGFEVPEEGWIKEHPDWVRQQLMEAVYEKSGIFNPVILSVFEDYMREKFRDYTLFWRVIVFHKWMKVFKVQIS